MLPMTSARPLCSDLDLRSTLEAMDDLAFVFDTSARPIFLNRPALRMLGFATVEEALDDIPGWGRAVRVLPGHGGEVADPRDMVQRALAGEKVTENFERYEPI